MRDATKKLSPPSTLKWLEVGIWVCVGDNFMMAVHAVQGRENVSSCGVGLCFI